MKIFRMQADVLFEAEDIIDALAKLAAHFAKLTKLEDSNLFEAESTITIEPLATQG